MPPTGGAGRSRRESQKSLIPEHISDLRCFQDPPVLSVVFHDLVFAFADSEWRRLREDPLINTAHRQLVTPLMKTQVHHRSLPGLIQTR